MPSAHKYSQEDNDFNMFILVNSENIIVGSAVNMPSEKCCSKRGQKIYQIPDSEYRPDLIGNQLVSYDSVEVLNSKEAN